MNLLLLETQIALTIVDQSFLCLWDSITGPHKEFCKRSVFLFVSVFLQSLLVPALRESSCLSVTAALFLSEMQAKMLCVALQQVALALFKL